MLAFRRFASKAKAVKKPQTASTVDYDINPFKDLMEQQLHRLTDNCSKLRVGRANPNIMDRLKVKHQGQVVPLLSIAQVAIRDPQNLQVITAERQATLDVEKAIRSGNLNLNPVQINDTTLTVPIPKMTIELRKSVLKQVDVFGQQAKERLRDVRQDARKIIKKADLTTNEVKKEEKNIQDLMNSYMKKVDEYVQRKQKEIETS